MGVSSDTSGLDLAAIVNGGEEFIKRLAEFQMAAAAYKQQLDDLNLGKGARAASDEAGRVLAAAKEKRDADTAALAKEMDGARSTLKAWSDSVKKAAETARSEADAKNAEAENNLAQAKSALSAASTKLGEAQKSGDTLLSEAQDKASKLLADAKAAAAKMESDAGALYKQADIRMSDAIALKDKYTEALARLQSVIVQSS